MQQRVDHQDYRRDVKGTTEGFATNVAVNSWEIFQEMS